MTSLIVGRVWVIAATSKGHGHIIALSVSQTKQAERPLGGPEPRWALGVASIRMAELLDLITLRLGE